MSSTAIALFFVYLLPCFSWLSHAYSPPDVGTRLAAWSECGKNTYIPRVYYQANDTNIYEVSYEAASATWMQPRLILRGGTVLAQTPLAVVHFTGSAINGNTNRIKLFFVDQNGLLSVIGYDPGNTNGWGSAINLGAKVYTNAEKPGSLGAFISGSEFVVWYQSDPSTIRCCRFTPANGEICAGNPQAGPLTNAYDGSGITGLVDGDGRWHIWYQTNVAPNPVAKHHFDGSVWDTSNTLMSAPPGTQLAAVTGSTIGGVYGTGPYIHLFSNNDMIYNYLTDSVWTGQPPCSAVPGMAPGWCTPISVAWVKNYRSGIAATGCGTNMRVYYISADSNPTIAELSAVDWGTSVETWNGNSDPPYWATGWYTTQKDLLAVTV